MAQPNSLFVNAFTEPLRSWAPFANLLHHEKFRHYKIQLSFPPIRSSNNQPLNGIEALAWGGSAGALAAFWTTPLDMIKTRIVMANQNNMSIKDAFVDVVRTNGVRGLFRGAGMRSAWFFGVCSSFFCVYEKLTKP
eukprot:Colp12_sorted_trinity150504_noHs@30820